MLHWLFWDLNRAALSTSMPCLYLSISMFLLPHHWAALSFQQLSERGAYPWRSLPILESISLFESLTQITSLNHIMCFICCITNVLAKNNNHFTTISHSYRTLLGSTGHVLLTSSYTVTIGWCWAGIIGKAPASIDLMVDGSFRLRTQLGLASRKHLSSPWTLGFLTAWWLGSMREHPKRQELKAARSFLSPQPGSRHCRASIIFYSSNNHKPRFKGGDIDCTSWWEECQILWGTCFKTPHDMWSEKSEHLAIHSFIHSCIK